MTWKCGICGYEIYSNYAVQVPAHMESHSELKAKTKAEHAVDQAWERLTWAN